MTRNQRGGRECHRINLAAEIESKCLVCGPKQTEALSTAKVIIVKGEHDFLYFSFQKLSHRMQQNFDEEFNVCTVNVCTVNVCTAVLWLVGLK